MRDFKLLYLYLISTVLLLILPFNAYSQSIARVEPPSWWIGIDRPLQLMIVGDNLKDLNVKSHNKNVKIQKVTNGDSDNYIFLDLELDKKLTPGTITFTLEKNGKSLDFSYDILEREVKSKERVGLKTSDALFLIMPDRFSNGDTSNDDIESLPDKTNRTLPLARHGGDISGIIKNLDYITSIGITALWSTPLLLDNEKSVSYHGYACADFYKIDPRFGTNNQYKVLVNESKKRGIKVFMDFVPNHCGSEHWWMNDLPFKNWINTFPKYTQSNFAMSTHADPYASKSDYERLITGWFDKTMPDMNLNNEFVLTYLTQNAIWWIEWAGLSGLRIDTYPYSEKHKISKLTEDILKVYPNLTILAESWFISPQEVAYWESGANNLDGYNSYVTNVMDFPLQDAISKAFNEVGDLGWGMGMYKIYKSLSLDYVYKSPFQLLIFAENHDTNRITEIVKKYPSKLKMIYMLLATMRGIPQLYYGTEINLSTVDGLLGHGEERLDMPGGWDTDQRSAFTGKGLSISETDLQSFTKQLFSWRKNSRAVHLGDFKHWWPESNLYVYTRKYKEEVVLTIINNNTKSLKIDWVKYNESLDGFSKGVDIITEKIVNIGDNLTIGPQSSMIIEFKNH